MKHGKNRVEEAVLQCLMNAMQRWKLEMEKVNSQETELNSTVPAIY